MANAEEVITTAKLLHGETAHASTDVIEEGTAEEEEEEGQTEETGDKEDEKETAQTKAEDVPADEEETGQTKAEDVPADEEETGQTKAEDVPADEEETGQTKEEDLDDKEAEEKAMAEDKDADVTAEADDEEANDKAQVLATEESTLSEQNGVEYKEVANDAEQLSEEDKARYRQIFDHKAVNDRLDLKGFKVLFRLLGEVITSEDADTMFDDADKNDDETIDFDEFCRLYFKFSQEEQVRKESMLRSIDRLFPTSDGEPVELKKVERLLLKLQEPGLDSKLMREKSDLRVEDIKSLVRSMDTDGNGLISKEEFVDTLCKHFEP